MGSSISLQVKMPDTGSHCKHLSGCPLTIHVMTGVEVVREGVKVVMSIDRSVRQATYTSSCSC